MTMVPTQAVGAGQDAWFEIPNRSCSAMGLFQVGQVIHSALDPSTTLFRNGPFGGVQPSDLYHKLRVAGSLEVEFAETGVVEISAAQSRAVDVGRIGDRGIPVIVQVLDTEAISSNNALLEGILAQHEIKSYLRRGNSPGNLFLVTKIQKVREYVRVDDNFTDPYFTNNSDALQNGDPFIWRYELEQICNPRDADRAFSEPYLPSHAHYDSRRQSLIRLILPYLFGWTSLMRFSYNTARSCAAQESNLDDFPSRPRTLVWKRLREAGEVEIASIGASGSDHMGVRQDGHARFKRPEVMQPYQGTMSSDAITAWGKTVCNEGTSIYSRPMPTHAHRMARQRPAIVRNSIWTWSQARPEVVGDDELSTNSDQSEEAISIDGSRECPRNKRATTDPSPAIPAITELAAMPQNEIVGILGQPKRASSQPGSVTKGNTPSNPAKQDNSPSIKASLVTTHRNTNGSVTGMEFDAFDYDTISATSLADSKSGYVSPFVDFHLVVARDNVMTRLHRPK